MTTLQIPTVNANQLKEQLKYIFSAKLTPYISSKPGEGKSSIIKEFAEQHNLKVIDVRLAQATPEDLQGFPTINKETGVATFTPFDVFPLEHHELPKGYKGWLLFLDELSSANKSVQCAAYKLILDRAVAQYNLHPSCVIAAAGNRAEDNAIVHTMSTALSSRLVHLNLNVSTTDWLEWAVKKKIHTSIITFLTQYHSSLNTFQSELGSDKTYACPRTWEFTDKLLKSYEYFNGKDSTKTAIKDIGFTTTLCGAIGTKSIEFLTFLKIYDKLTPLAEVLKDPLNCKVPEESAEQFALITELGLKIDSTNEDKICTYIERTGFGEELKLHFIRITKNYNPNIIIDLYKFPKFNKLVLNLTKRNM